MNWIKLHWVYLKTERILSLVSGRTNARCRALSLCCWKRVWPRYGQRTSPSQKYGLHLVFFSNRVIDRWNSLDETSERIRGAFCDDALYKLTFTFTLLMHPACTVSKIDSIKLDPQEWVSSRTSPLSLVMWIDVKLRPHKVSTKLSMWCY